MKRGKRQVSTEWQGVTYVASAMWTTEMIAPRIFTEHDKLSTDNSHFLTIRRESRDHEAQYWLE